MTDIIATRRATSAGLGAAVHRNRALTPSGILERLFTTAFQGLVYAQIWEDPVIDMEALRIGPDDHIVAIASGGCNILSYLVGNPSHVTAIDLNGHHVALNRLKLSAARHLPDHTAFFRFFGRADDRANIAAYDRHLRPELDDTTRAYWDKRDLFGRRRISLFQRRIHRHGLLGNFIGAAHLLARAHGHDPRAMLEAKSLDEQRAMFETHLLPVLHAPFVRWLVGRPASLYGLGIPPAQYHSLAGDHEDGIVGALRERLERLACGFPLEENYFAWQAFGRGYAPGQRPSIPPYLDARHFEAVRARANRIDVLQSSVTAALRARAPRSLDCYVLLDAQDWMTDRDLIELWTEIDRTARPGARVIFRTAARDSLLPGRVPDALLSQWAYDQERCRDLTTRDRSSIYGGFHLYERRPA